MKSLFKKDKLFDIIEEIIKSKNIRYITNEEKNPIETTEVNECYYILLGSICLSITSIQLDNENIHIYFQALKNIIKIIQNLNDDLNIFLNEMYIIDELIKIYDVLNLNNKIDIKKISEIIKNLRENSEILQTNNNNKIESLIEKFINLDELIKGSLNYEDKEYYDLLRYIYYKEIKKTRDINYRSTIFEYLIKDSELIINSNEVLQLLLKSLIIPLKEKFIKSIPKILNEKNEIINLIENLLNDINENDNNSFVLSETLLYYFEKNSHIYLNNTINNNKEKILFEGEPLEVFKECLIFLENYKYNPKKLKDKKKNICKLFSIGYIKTYLYTFVTLINISSSKLKDSSKIIKEINNASISKIIKLYIYKIIYNKNNKIIDVFVNPDNIQKYRLSEYDEFNKFINFPQQNPFNYKYKNLINEKKQEYESFYKTLEKLKIENFENINIIDKINIEKLGIDAFYFYTCNLILSCLKYKDFEKSKIYSNFYNNVGVLLFKKKNSFFPAFQFLYCPEKFEKIKKDYQITPENLEILLFSYRYCLNLLWENKKGNVFSFLYNKKNIENINKYYFPGNDISEFHIYEIYSKIIEHFSKLKPNYGCYVCLCRKGYYIKILDDYQDPNLLNKKCPFCHLPIGLKPGRVYGYNYIKRENYFRIFKNETEMKDKKKSIITESMTLDSFQKKYIEKYFIKEKGITSVNENHFKKNNKVVRNLSQISYRLLNFILYSHLFFARLYTDNTKFDKFLPSNMNWMDVLSECWEHLKKELNKKNITVIELFMNYIFFDLFDALNAKINNQNFNEFMKFEEDLDKLILKKVKEFKEKSKSLDKLKNPDKNDKNSSIYLLEEEYDYSEYPDYPFYKYFYFSDYINEEYLIKQMKHIEKDKYPVLHKYLNHYSFPQNTNNYSLNYLKMYNEVLNMFNDKYSHVIVRKEEKENDSVLKDEEIYKNNKKLINEFITFYNKLKIKDKNKNLIQLSEESKLSNFFIDDKNEVGKSYKNIYQKFIEQQNKDIKELLDIKINDEIFDVSCKNKVNIQNIKESEIFTLNFPKNLSFINIAFECSYRNIVINNVYKSYNQFEINYDLIEEKMTESLLNNKKLFNNIISNFVYKNEDLIFENVDVITKFNNLYVSEDLILNDKVILYQFYKENFENINLFKIILDDFITLIIFLNNNSNMEKIDLKHNSKIYETFPFLENKISKNFEEMFKDKDSFTINKLSNIFEYYQLLIFDNIKSEIKEYQIEINKDIIDGIKNYFNQTHKINSEIFASSIRKFIVVFLSKEKNKSNKIKLNENNIINYLNIQDIWDKNIYEMKDFMDELDELKNLNIQLNQVIYLYEILRPENNEEFFKDVIEQIKKNEEMEKKNQEIEEPKIEPNLNNQEEETIDEIEEKDKEKETKENDEDEEEDDNYYDLKDDDADEELYDRN